MKSEQIKQRHQQHICSTYARYDLCLTKGEGSQATDPEGKQYIDFTSGIGVNSLGWCDRQWVDAVSQQAATLQHTSNLFYTQPASELAELLCQKSHMKQVFFANSGAEANECAIKAARKYSLDHYGDEKRHVILTLNDSFHGRTMATLSATGQEVFHQHFFPFLSGFRHIEPNTSQPFSEVLTKDVCAVMIEPIQGEGGVNKLDKNWLQALEKACQQQDILLIADEVQTGIGRTGHFIACEEAGIQPDIITLAKGLGGGLPISATLFNDKCADTLKAGHHATTYGANPICCAGALVVLKRMTPEFLHTVEQKGQLLRELLHACSGIESISGAGLMLGITLKKEITPQTVIHEAMNNGLLVLSAKNKIRLLPPLTLNEQDLKKGVEILIKAIETVTN